jgi:hypothetical protein
MRAGQPEDNTGGHGLVLSEGISGANENFKIIIIMCRC